MNLIATPTNTSEQFFRQSAGTWYSQRRYYTLNSDQEPLEATSTIEVAFLSPDHPELLTLAQAHHLSEPQPFQFGAKVSWHSTYTNRQQQPLTGATTFGIQGNYMYRDRGFSTTQPILAHFELVQPNLLRLHTSYEGSSFEEEIKLIGDKHRTRQTISSRAGQEIMVAQYLETRL